MLILRSTTRRYHDRVSIKEKIPLGSASIFRFSVLRDIYSDTHTQIYVYTRKIAKRIFENYAIKSYFLLPANFFISRSRGDMDYCLSYCRYVGCSHLVTYLLINFICVSISSVHATGLNLKTSMYCA